MSEVDINDIIMTDISLLNRPTRVAFPVSATKLEELIREAVDRLDDAGLDVRVVICDQGATNRSLASSLGIAAETPFFMHRSKKIYFMYDPPHLLKSLRNNLKVYNFTVRNHSVKWQYVEDLYNFDSSQRIKLAPRLTERHIVLPCFSKMKVKLASQIFSHSVASGISLLKNLGKLPEEAGYTAEFIAEMNDLFDCFNARYTDSVPLRRRMMSTSRHEATLRQSLATMSELKVICGSKVRIHCVSGWQIAISALLGLWDDLRRDGVKFIMTRKLSQDRLENFFARVRRGLGNADNPSCQKFRFSFRHAFLNGLLQPSGSNCEIDPDDFFEDIISFLRSVPAGKSARPCRTQITRANTADHSWAMDLAVANGFRYISGYFARRIFCRCKCKTLESLVKAKTLNLENDTNNFLALKAFKRDKELGGLIAPGDAYHQTISGLETVFVNNISSLLHKPQVCSHLETISRLSLEDTPFHEHDRCCGCFDTWPYFIKLFMTVRIRWEVRERNRNRSTGNKRALKQNAKLRKLGQ